MHSSFNGPIFKWENQFCYRKPSIKSIIYINILRLLILHEVSVFCNKTFEPFDYLNLSLQDITAMSKVFGEISFILMVIYSNCCLFNMSKYIWTIKMKNMKRFRTRYWKMFSICTNWQILFVKAVILTLQIYLLEFMRVSIH